VTSGALVVKGGAGVSGNFSLGGRVVGDLIPAADNFYDLGAPLYKWNDLYLGGDLEVAGETTLGGDLYVTGQITGSSLATDTLNVSGTITATNLAGTIVTAAQPNITQVGTITSGTWNGGTIPITHGGTGGTSISQALNNLLPSGEDLGYVLTTGGPGIYYWSNANVGGGGGGGGTLSGIANSALTNSSITINGTTISLGGSSSSVTAVWGP
jgi:hypothetical protein